MARSLPTYYEEASSGSDDENKDDDGSTSSSLDEPAKRNNGSQRSDSSEDSSSDSDEDSSDLNDSDESSESDRVKVEHEPTSQRKGYPKSHELIENDGSDDESSSDEEDLPLQERIKRKEERGISMRKSRERKSLALDEAAKRLANYKRGKINDEKDGGGGRPAKKKKSKHAPTEASSKRSDYFRRGAPRLNESGIGVDVGAHRYKPLDPRTSNLSVHLNEDQFENNYSFLEEMRNKEIGELKQRIAARRVTGRKGKRMRHKLNIGGGSLEDDEDLLRKLKQERADLVRRKIDRAAKQSVKRKIQDDVAQGKRGVYFLKRKEKKQLELEAKLDVIRKRGGNKAVEKIMEKRRRKAKSRDSTLFAK